MTTASHLAEVCQKAIDEQQDLPWNIPESLGVQFSDPQLESFASLGLGVHHAGLSRDDRRAVEELFIQRKLSVIVATSVRFFYLEQVELRLIQVQTLAVGVNFPAHAVVIKGVMQWAGAGWVEYSSQDIMQMLGRAGRPQFDREGIAIIMCEKHLETKYSLLSTGGSHLESTLHHNLTEHINSEIGLGTISSVETTKQWLRKTLLFRRIQKNSLHYNIGANPSNEATFKDTLMRVGERQMYQKLSEHESIRFPVKKAETTGDKVSLLIQAVLGGVPLMSNDFRSLNSQPHMEALNVMRHAPRMIAALVDVALVTKNGAVIVHGTSLMRSINAKAWEDRPAVLKQLEGVGEKS
ncbi:Sec63 [Ceratobasidium sp. 428]|nr:Sec63 [Ceratobasidium sp. 428]